MAQVASELQEQILEYILSDSQIESPEQVVETFKKRVDDICLLVILDQKNLKTSIKPFVPPNPEDILERWKTRSDKKLNPIEFIRIYYSEFLHKGLNRGHFRKIDPSLYTALNNWLRKDGHSIPEELGLGRGKNKYDEQTVTEAELAAYRKVSALRSVKRRSQEK